MLRIDVFPYPFMLQAGVESVMPVHISAFIFQNVGNIRGFNPGGGEGGSVIYEYAMAKGLASR